MESSSKVATRRGKASVPLCSHGMPKTPYTAEGTIRPHRFSTLGAPPVQLGSPPSSPGGPMSPPMSAKSFGTFIDSAPSTPAYSPRTGAGWEKDNSTIMLLSPVSSAPSSPPEPQWEMMTPPASAKQSAKKAPVASSLEKEVSLGRQTPVPPSVEPIREEQQKENEPPSESHGKADGDAANDAKEEQGVIAAPLGKLATRMKSILRRKTVTDKKSVGEPKTDRKRKKYQELDYMEDVHWTEM